MAIVKRTTGGAALARCALSAFARVAFDGRACTMYTYIMQRTQIYLSDKEMSALDQQAKETGRTRSQLIREAIDHLYLASKRQALRGALARSRGAWRRRREDGASYVERSRRGRLGALHDA